MKKENFKNYYILYKYKENLYKILLFKNNLLKDQYYNFIEFFIKDLLIIINDYIDNRNLDLLLYSNVFLYNYLNKKYDNININNNNFNYYLIKHIKDIIININYFNESINFKDSLFYFSINIILEMNLIFEFIDFSNKNEYEKFLNFKKDLK